MLYSSADTEEVRVDRRSFLTGLLGGASGLLLPDLPDRQRVYSFPSTLSCPQPGVMLVTAEGERIKASYRDDLKAFVACTKRSVSVLGLEYFIKFDGGSVLIRDDSYAPWNLDKAHTVEITVRGFDREDSRLGSAQRLLGPADLSFS